ncbi:MAG TPA: aminopeptidase P N-terminal domain-containing protein [Thermoanaerobaculia bacterium]|jgi:Xaa-Pro aminopeptidase|nr:aminopeptidase P N-terminal domain-containing protein [Thermoanaerobaculia bacterium]
MKTSLEERRDAVAKSLGLSDEILLVGAGSYLSIPGGADQTYPFHAHNEYFYLADRDRPGAVAAFDPHEGWVDFIPEVTEKEKVWVGDQPSEGTPLTGLEPWLAARHGRTIVQLGTPVLLPPGVFGDAERSEQLREKLLHARRPKSEEELERMRRAAAATAAGFAAVRPLIRPGVTERQLQIELEVVFLRAGADRTAYDSIVGSGPNSAIFHFSPSSRVLQAGELLLIDAGAEVLRYACDVTRTYPVAPTFSPLQRDVYAVVLAAEKRAVAKCRAGKEFKELHLETAADMVQGLLDLGFLRGTAQSLVEDGTYALFFPHGLGHLLGLGVRDASGLYPGRERDPRPELETLRLDLPLERGYVTTIEPGLYFSPVLLQSRERREKFRQQVDWEKVDRTLSSGEFGGIRIEDNVLVTAGEPEVLTAAIPKEIGEIEM